MFWPSDVPEPTGAEDLDCYLALFAAWGFEECESFEPEAGFLKIAIFATNGEFNHVAKQLPSGNWSSKGGVLHDFRHGTLDALGGSPVMPCAELVSLMRRRDDGMTSYAVEEQGLILSAEG